MERVDRIVSVIFVVLAVVGFVFVLNAVATPL
jgi:hypothetical protein